MFPDASYFTDAYGLLITRSAELSPIAQSFIRNMNRVRGLGQLPLSLVYSTTLNESARVEALVKKGLSIDDPRLFTGDQFDATLFAEIEAEKGRLIEEWKKALGFSDRRLRNCINSVNQALDVHKDLAWEGVQATLSAMLMGLWTAFEVLAEDTWIVAVNNRPDPLAKRILESAKDLGTGTQIKSISWPEIAGQGFDLRTSMGTVLVRQRAVDFKELKAIRKAYKIAFNEAFESIFEKYMVELGRLEALRNLYAHKGGIVDEKFIRRMEGDSEYKDLKTSLSVWINGGYVAAKANAVCASCTELISAVDNWLVENPATNDAASDS